MAGQIRMSPETMRTRATQTDKQAQTVQEVISTMDKLLATLKGEWEGDAVKGYEDRYNKIKPAFKNAKELLDETAAGCCLHICGVLLLSKCIFSRHLYF